MTATKPLYIENITNKANTEPTHKLRFSSRRNAIKDTINDMIRIIQEDMLLPYTRNKATSIIRDAGLVDGRDKHQVALAIYIYLQDTVTYVEDPQDLEYMQRTYRLLEETKAGDCDDFSIAGASLLQSLNIPVKIRVVGTESPDYYNHVYLLVNIDSKWVPFDPIYKSRRMGQEPEIIYRKQDFEIAPINELFGKDYSLAVILNGDTRMKGNKLGLYNKLYTTLAGNCLNSLTRTLGADTQDDEYKRAYEFFMFYSYPRITEDSVIPEEIKEIVEKDEEIQQAYKENRLTLDTIRGNQELLGYMLAGMLDHYTLSGNFWQNLWSGIKKVGNVIWQGAKAILPAVIPGVGTAISAGMNVVENIVSPLINKPSSNTTSNTTTTTATQTVKPVATTQVKQPTTTIQAGKTTLELPALTQQQLQSQNILQQPLQSASNLLNNQYISALLNQIPGVNQVYSTFQNAIPFFQQITPYFTQMQGDSLGAINLLNPIVSNAQLVSNAQQLSTDTANLRDIDNLINAALSSPLSLPLAQEKRKSLLTAIISKANQYTALKAELDDLYNTMFNYFPNVTKKLAGFGDEPKAREALSRKQDLENRVKALLTELYIKIYLLWNLLTPEQQKAVVQKMQKYEVYSPTPGNAPYGFDNERFFRLEMQDLQDQVESERLEYYAVINLLKELVNTITTQQETLNALKKNERQDIVDLISFYNSQVSGLGQFSTSAARLDYRKDITENVRALEEAIKYQKQQLEKLVEMQDDATIKLLVKTLLELQVRIIKAKAKDEQNQPLIDSLKDQLNQKSVELQKALEQIGYISDETKQQLANFKEQTEKYQEKIEELSNTYKEDLDKIITEKNDVILTNQENYLTERNKLVTDYETQLTEKEKNLDYVETMYNAAKSMIDLLPEKARQIINSFSEQDFISPSPARIKEIYKMYAQLRFELKEQFNEMKDEVIKRLEKKQFNSRMALAQVRADLDLIKDMMMQNPVPQAKPYVDEFEKRYKALQHELEETKEDADLMYFNAIDSGIMTIAKGVKQLQMYVIASIKNMNPELPVIEDSEEEIIEEEEIEEEEEINF